MKRLIALLLSVNILLTMIPLEAFAAQLQETVPEETVIVEETVTCTQESEPSEAVTEPTVCTEVTEETLPAETTPTTLPEEMPEETVPETTVAEEVPLPSETVPEVTGEEAMEDAAQEEALTEEFQVGEILTWVCEEELPGEEEYFAAYAESQFYESSTTFGIAAGRTLDEGHKRIYDALAPEFHKIATGQKDSAMIPVGEYLGELVTVSLNGKKVAIPCNPAEEVNIRNLNVNLSILLTAILADFPYELYWFDKTVGVSAIPVTNGNKTCIAFYFSVCSQYRKNSLNSNKYTLSNYELKTDKTSAASTAAANARKIVEKYEDLADYEKLLAYKDEICALVDYNQSAASSSYRGGYGDPWQMIWVFDENENTKVVCEGYSKAFQYLCDMSSFENDIVCYSVTGYLNWRASNPGDHMWNIVTINDHSYLMDATNCDSGFDLFLRGGTANNGVYIIDGQTFRYRAETTALWGEEADSILNLASADPDPSNLPQKPNLENGEVWTGEMLLETLEGVSGSFHMSNHVVINTKVTLPEDITLEIYAPYNLTIAEGGELIVPGKLYIGAGGVLRVKPEGSLVNSGEILAAENAVVINNGTITNNGTFNSYISITGTLEGAPVTEYMPIGRLQMLLNAGDDVYLEKQVLIDESLIIPPGTNLIMDCPGSLVVSNEGTLSVQGQLTICDADASVQIAAGGELVNCGRIEVRSGLLDMDGSYVDAEGEILLMYTCDAQGNESWGAVQGIKPEWLKVIAETAAGDAVIRKAMEDVRKLREDEKVPPEGPFDFAIRFVGETVLSSDLELPVYCNPVIVADASLTVPEGRKLTDHSGMAVYGKLILLGQAEATGWPIMAADSTCLVGAENCSNYYYDNLPLEELVVTADATTVLVNETIELKLESWLPVGAKYFGDYRVQMEPADVAQWDEVDHRTLQIRSNGSPCAVNLTVSATDAEGTVLKNSAGEPIVKQLFLRFAAEKVYLYKQETKADFYEADGTWGLYPGSSLHFYANLTGQSKYADEGLIWSDIEISEDIATVSHENGIMTITAANTLDKMASITFTVSEPMEVSQPQTYTVSLRPRSQTLDLVLGDETVTGQKVFYDLNRQESDTLTLLPETDPADAYVPGGIRSDGKKSMLTWKSSNTGIATVDNNGVVTFTGRKTGSVKITATANFGSKKDVAAAVTFNVVALPQRIFVPENYAAELIGGSSATYAAYDEQNPAKALKSSAVRWYLCDENGDPVAYHPYAAVSASGKLTTRGVADEDVVYLMAQVVGDENSARLAAPLEVKLYPALESLLILDEEDKPVQNQTLLISDRETPVLTWTAIPKEAVRSAAWKSSSTSVATIDAEGVITVRKPGTAKFTLTAMTLNGKKTTAAVTMKFGVFTEGLDLSALLPGEQEPTAELEGLTLKSGESMTFYGTNISSEERPVTTPGITWSVDNKNYASISSKGVLKAKAVYNPAEVTVFAKSKDGAVTEPIRVKIEPKDNAVMILHEGKFVTKTTQILQLGQGMTLESSEPVTWSSSKTSVVTVDENGTLTPHKKGSATITARTADKRTATVTVKVTTGAQMTIETKKGAPYAVAAGRSLDLMATIRFADGSKSTKVTWTVSDPSVATISSSGRLTAHQAVNGRTTVTVTATAIEGVWSASKDIAIAPLTRGIEIYGPFGSDRKMVDISNTTQNWDMLWDQEGGSFSLVAKTFPAEIMGVNWSSSSNKVATVDADGNVNCLGSGTVTITATAKDGSGKKASFKLTVYKTMSKDSLQLPETAIAGAGKSLTLTKLNGYAIDTLATNKTLRWVLTYPDGRAVPSTVATLSGGVLKTKNIQGPVQLLVTATATDGSEEEAQCLVTVYKATAGVKLYSESGVSLSSKTVSLPLGSSLSILPDTTNVKQYGTDDDKTADEYLPDGKAWQISLSKNLVDYKFDGQVMKIWAKEGAQVNQTVKITLRAADGSGKSAYVTVKFTAALPE